MLQYHNIQHGMITRQEDCAYSCYKQRTTTAELFTETNCHLSTPQKNGSIVFARWRQCAHIRGHIGAAWRMQFNLCFRPQPKRQINQFGRFCTSHGRKSLYFTMGTHSPKLIHLVWDLDPHLTHDSLSQTKPPIQTASQSVQLFSHIWPHSVAILYNGRPFPKIAPSHGVSGLPSNTRFLSPI